jgi:hypothetical protein
MLANELIPKAKATTTLKSHSATPLGGQNIRYLGIDVGAGGFVPHDAQSILDNRYYCKDHVVMLEALPAAAGIDSSPALINQARLLAAQSAHAQVFLTTSSPMCLASMCS